MGRILVVGANGTVGNVLVQQLTDAGQAVRRAGRGGGSGGDQVTLDLATGAGLAQAFANVDAAFLMCPPGHVDQDRLLNPAIDAARAAGVRKLVLMTAMGADADPNAPLRVAERHLEASGLRWNVIRPNWFMQNFNSYWLAGILGHDTIFLPTGSARGSFIDARDIAAVAAVLLTRANFDGQAFDLTGGEALDHHEVAAILSRVVGRTITYAGIEPEAMREHLLAAGLPPPYADFLLLILGFFKAGYAERITDAVARITGRAPRRFEDYARDHRAAWAR
jgi:uncharacterized protein YbjT (DUF2867 family)